MKNDFLNFLKKNYFQGHHGHWFLILIATFVSVSLVSLNSNKLQVSLIGAFEEEVQFDGTAYPIADTYSWSNIEYSDWKADINEVATKYNLDDLKTKWPSYDYEKYIDSLAAKDTDSANYRNTYLIPWGFPYDLKSPYQGSHPGTDQRGMLNTPVFSVSNGKVIKVKDSDGTVCIEIPDVDFEGKIQDLYMCYLHLNYRKVSEGDIVQRGQEIGGIGEKGFATTPHLHLQLDLADAPWHPYWPFSSTEAANIGLNFVEAVNIGLGRENMEIYTRDPMEFIEANLVDTSYIESEIESETETENDSDSDNANDTVTTEDSPADDTVIEENPEIVDDIDLDVNSENTETYIYDDVASLSIETSDYYPLKTQKILICTLNDTGDVTLKKPTNAIFLELISGKGEFDKENVDRNDFENGCSSVSFTPGEDAKDAIEFYFHDAIHQLKGSLVIHEFEFKDVSESDQKFEAIKYAFLNNITTGYPDGTFKPENSVSRVEAVAFIVRALKFDPISNPKFDLPDASSNEWYAGILAKAMDEGMVSGYPDGTVRLTNQVIGAELLKIFLEAFADVREAKEGEQWYDRFVEYAKSEAIIGNDFDPSKPLNREEVVEIIYKARDLITS